MPDIKPLMNAVSKLLYNRQHLDLHEDDRKMLEEAYLGVEHQLSEAEKPVAVTCDAGEEIEVIARFDTVPEAEDFLAQSAGIDPDWLAAGYYGIDAPEEMVNPPAPRPTPKCENCGNDGTKAGLYETIDARWNGKFWTLEMRLDDGGGEFDCLACDHRTCPEVASFPYEMIVR